MVNNSTNKPGNINKTNMYMYNLPHAHHMIKPLNTDKEDQVQK